ncbi:MAG TPA: type II secretion system F family protein [Methanomicrobiales archaeon]|nr:type II secretion system F family protein [Methanomicrobiales archaeon]
MGDGDALPVAGGQGIIDSYKRFCYHHGKFLEHRASDRIARLLYQGDVEMTPGMFLSLWIGTAVIAAVAGVAGSVLVFASPWSPFAVDTPLISIPWAPVSVVGPLPYILIVSAAVAGLTLGAFPFYLQNQITNKKLDIERQIPYALAFMSILASSGETPLDVIRRVALEDYGHISREFGKVIFRVDILGEDAVSAMNDLIIHTPSEIFRAICIDITNIMYGGGGLTEYLAMKSRDLMALRRQAYREFVESLSVFAEGYLGGVVMTITLGVLGIIISGALSIELGPFTPGQLLMLLIYAVTPIINLVFLQVLSVKYSTNP